MAAGFLIELHITMETVIMKAGREVTAKLLENITAFTNRQKAICLYKSSDFTHSASTERNNTMATINGSLPYHPMYPPNQLEHILDQTEYGF